MIGLFANEKHAITNEIDVKKIEQIIDKIKYIDEPFWTVDTLFYTQIDEELVLPEYIYYYLTTIDFKHYNEGTTIPSLRTETLNRIVVSLPELGIQSSIVKILGNFEKKIKA